MFVTKIYASKKVVSLLQLERNNPIPLYEQLKNIIVNKIRNGQYEIDQQIPSERELCEQFDVSRITVRQAISLAVNEGLLYRTHGRGTFVSKPKIEQRLQKVNTFHQTLVQQGLVATTKKIKFQVVANDFHLSRLLNVNMNEKIVNLQLVGSGNEDPIVFYDSYFPAEIGEKIHLQAEQALEKNMPFSTLDLYGQSLGVTITHTEQTFEATVSDEFLSNILHVRVGSPILLVTSIIYSGYQPLEYKLAHYRGDKYKFFTTREFDPEMFK